MAVYGEVTNWNVKNCHVKYWKSLFQMHGNYSPKERITLMALTADSKGCVSATLDHP